MDYGGGEENTTCGKRGIRVGLNRGARLGPRRGRGEKYRERGPRRPTDSRR